MGATMHKMTALPFTIGLDLDRGRGHEVLWAQYNGPRGLVRVEILRHDGASCRRYVCADGERLQLVSGFGATSGQGQITEAEAERQYVAMAPMSVLESSQEVLIGFVSKLVGQMKADRVSYSVGWDQGG